MITKPHTSPEPMTPEEFIDIRNFLGLKQWQLADKLGYADTRQISRYEHGDTPIKKTVAVMMRLLREEQERANRPGSLTPE